MKSDDEPDSAAGLAPSSGMPRSQSNQSFSSITKELLVDSGVLSDTRSLSDEAGTLRQSPEKTMNIPSLTEAQQRAITGWVQVMEPFVNVEMVCYIQIWN